jgi:predicted metal-binding membrane protein
MWIVMMVPMMLPTVAPVLWRHREAVKMSGARRPGALTAVAGVGYFFVWTVVGVAAFSVGASVTSFVMDHAALARATPILVGVTVTIGGAIQLTSWKARQLADCRWGCLRHASRPVGVVGAWRDGVRLGLRCVACCGNLMAILLVMGAMDLRAMALAGAAITAERLSPGGERVARVTGAMLVAAGSVAIARAVGI